jgi:hypothetical protein
MRAPFIGPVLTRLPEPFVIVAQIATSVLRRRDANQTAPREVDVGESADESTLAVTGGHPARDRRALP